jgi:hypothetical protein
MRELSILILIFIKYMEIKYNDKIVSYDSFFEPSKSKEEPFVKIDNLGYKYYLLIMYDPDAIHGTHWHWIVSNITKNDIKTGNVLLEYNGPNPPDNKKHRYFFELYGSNKPFTKNKFEERNISLEDGKKTLGLIVEPLLMDKFFSEREKYGGQKVKKSQRRKRKNKKITKRNKSLKY